MHNELPKDGEATHVLPQQRVAFTGDVGEDTFFTTDRGFEIAVQRKGLHNFIIGVIKPKAKMTHDVSIRMKLGGLDSVINTRKPKEDVVVVDASLYNYSDRILVSIAEGDEHDMFVFFRDELNIKSLIMVSFVGISPYASQADLTNFFEQGKA